MTHEVAPAVFVIHEVAETIQGATQRCHRIVYSLPVACRPINDGVQMIAPIGKVADYHKTHLCRFDAVFDAIRRCTA
jgi:hypothetical protein